MTPDALKPAVSAAVAAGIPVVPAFNSGINQWRDMGGLEYFGQDETLAGESAGKASPPEAPRTSSVWSRSRDGATILIGGFGMAGMPTTLVNALIAQGARTFLATLTR